VDSPGGKSFDAYSAAVLKRLTMLPRILLRSLVDSVPRGMAEGLRLGGGKIKY
jgi:hypothetical protein